MEKKTVITYSLLTHLKETRKGDYSNLVELFFPIVKKSLVEYAKDNGIVNVKGKSISEIGKKVNEFFGIEIPISILDFILLQIGKEINDENTFAYYRDKSFIINTFVFNDIDDEINSEKENIEVLSKDFEEYCKLNNYKFDFNELIRFICSQKIELFVSKRTDSENFPFHIPKYISVKFNDDKYYKIISDIYLGSLISSYFEYKLETPVATTELLIDTNFFISLINLNTHEAYLTCNQLFKIGQRMGYKFSILFSTVDQIKNLLSSRIQDFASKEIGLIKEADVFGACIRRNLDKTQLERIKDKVDYTIRELNIDLIYEVRINDIVRKSRNSDKYQELLKIRNNQKLSALNDTIAYNYVIHKRGKNINEFADVRCWFLNNTYHRDYFIDQGFKLHERYKISANELLSLLWLANPNLEQFDIEILTKGGLGTYIAKYRHLKTPSINTIKDINSRAKQALEEGQIEEKDVFRISIRMAEGQLSNGEAAAISNLPDEEFIDFVNSLRNDDKDISDQVGQQTELLQKIHQQNIDLQYNLAIERYNRDCDQYVERKKSLKIIKFTKAAYSYVLFVLVISILWLLNSLHFKFIEEVISVVISFILFIVTLFIRFVDHKSTLNHLRFLINRGYRNSILSELRTDLIEEYNANNPKPKKEQFGG